MSGVMGRDRLREIRSIVAADIALGFTSSLISLDVGEDVRWVGGNAVEAARANGCDAHWHERSFGGGRACEVLFLDRYR